MRKNGLILSVLAIAALIFTSCASSESFDRSRVVANPIDLNYSFHALDTVSIMSTIPPQYLAVMTEEQKKAACEMLMGREKNSSSAREAADPVVTIFKGSYYLFPSKSKGYWTSQDMQHWDYIPVDETLPIDLYAPTTMIYKDELYWMTSDINQLYKTSTPEDGSSWKLVTDHLTPYPSNPVATGHDPDLLLDDDGRVYLYWGCSNVENIMGIELDPNNNFASIGEPVTLITHNEAIYGWENPGDHNEKHEPGYNEGASIFKLNGKYYLQYASPGTEYDTYGDGLYIGDNPLGPFKHVDYSPMSEKPGGWMTGAGHGDTFQDKYGNWWHVATTVISQRMNFERRIGFYPIIFTPKGNMYAMTEFSDYPYILPDKKVDWATESPWTGWMNLSVGKEMTASSSLTECPASNASDNTIKTMWSAMTGNPDEWLCINLGKECRVDAVQTNFGDKDFGAYDKNNPKLPYKYIIEVSKDGKTWKMVCDKSANDTDNPHSLAVLDQSENAQYVRITNKGELSGKFSIYDLRVFGSALGKAPAEAGKPVAERQSDSRRIKVSWAPAEGATGYILRWGTDPDELYLTCETSKPELELGLYNQGISYYFTVDAFNESGVTKGTQQALCK